MRLFLGKLEQIHYRERLKTAYLIAAGQSGYPGESYLTRRATWHEVVLLLQLRHGMPGMLHEL